jgi:hypothetical protein
MNASFVAGRSTSVAKATTFRNDIWIVAILSTKNIVSAALLLSFIRSFSRTFKGKTSRPTSICQALSIGRGIDLPWRK